MADSDLTRLATQSVPREVGRVNSYFMGYYSNRGQEPHPLRAAKDGPPKV
jgi:hypothetical protein